MSVTQTTVATVNMEAVIEDANTSTIKMDTNLNANTETTVNRNKRSNEKEK